MALDGYVFISYSSKDGSIVKQLTDAMGANNISYWKAPEMIAAGSNYAREIPKAIEECEVFLLILSETAQQSIWVEKELDAAICARKKVIPIKIDSTPLNDLYRFYLNNVQMLLAAVSNGKILNLFELTEKMQEILTGKTIKEDSVGGKSIGDMKKGVRPDGRINALRINRIPIECEFCGGAVEQSSVGVYVCLSCGRENYDDFQKIRNYLERVGSAPAAVIARNTGVPMKTIEHFWSEEYLETQETLIQDNRDNKKGVWHSERWKR